MRALILSAGFGERLRPLTLKRAKPAIEFLNMPMLGYPYFWLSTLGLTDVVFNTHYLPETVRQAAMKIVTSDVNLHFSHEDQILGSGGGIWNSRFDLMGEKTFAVANADGVVIDPDLDLFKKMLSAHEDADALASLLVCPLEGVGQKIPGVWVRRDGFVAGFGLTRPEPETYCYHFASYMLLSDRIWPFLPEGSSNILYDVLQPRIAQGERVLAFLADQLTWFETGNQNDLLAATQSCLDHLSRPGSPYCGVIREILHRVGPPYHMRSSLPNKRLIADSALLDANVKLDGFVVVGERAKIEANARLTDSVVQSDVTVPASADLTRQVVI